MYTFFFHNLENKNMFKNVLNIVFVYIILIFRKEKCTKFKNILVTISKKSNLKRIISYARILLLLLLLLYLDNHLIILNLRL